MRAFELCLREAIKAHPHCRPNPAVGAVIVSKGKLIGKGHTQAWGGHHAEVMAIRSVKNKRDLAQASLYVSLSPCSHHGKTPPCLDILHHHQLKDIHLAFKDPNPNVTRLFDKKIKQYGLEVSYDFPSDIKRRLYELNEGFFFSHLLGRPLVTLKLAMTADGKMATHRGDSKWITGRESRLRVHQLRNEADAILLGEQAVILDNPRLNVRMPKTPKRTNLLRVILNPAKPIPPRHHVLSDSLPSLFIVGNKLPKTYLRDLKSNKEKIDFPVFKGHFDLKQVLNYLKKKELSHVFVEGGSSVAGDFIRENLVDRVFFFIAPKILGDGFHGLSAFTGKSKVGRINECLKLKQVCYEPFGQDICISGILNAKLLSIKERLLKEGLKKFNRLSYPKGHV